MDTARTSALGTLADLQRLHSQMLAALNHEIRTPLTGILGMADLLLETDLDEQQQEYVESSRRCAEKLLESMSNAVEYAAVMAGHLELSESAFHLPEALRAAVASHQPRASSRQVEIELILDPDIPFAVVGDVVRFRQVLGILISHALTNCQEDVVSVAVSTFPRHGGINLLVSVTDNGPGLTPYRLARLFDPPQVGGYDEAGMELGLPLASELVQKMGGVLEAESLPGSGLLITLTLPLGTPESAGETALPVGSGSSSRRRILLVEDNEVAQRFMSTVLARKGYQVTVAPGGPQAAEAVRAEQFDAIVMDVQMPGMDGIETTRHLRRLPNGRRVPIIACTANTSTDVRSACLDAGMNEFLAKPVQTSELIEVVSRTLAGR